MPRLDPLRPGCIRVGFIDCRGLLCLLIVQKVLPIVLPAVEQLADVASRNLLSTLMHAQVNALSTAFDRRTHRVGTLENFVGHVVWVVYRLAIALRLHQHVELLVGLLFREA